MDFQNLSLVSAQVRDMINNTTNMGGSAVRKQEVTLSLVCVF